MNKEYQVIIVGSGPAGAASAKALKDEGINDVLVIERDKLPRNKICSAVLFGQAQVLLKKYFGCLPPDNVYCEPKIIKSGNIHEWNKEKGFFPYVWELPKDGQTFPQDFYNIWRREFDYWLLNKAGVEYLDNCRFRNYSQKNEKLKLDVSVHEKEDAELYCSYLIGADGGGSRVRALLDPAWRKQEMEIAIYQGYFHFSDMGSLEDAHWYVFFEPEIGEAFSAVHRKDDFLTLAVCGFKGRSLKKSMEDFKSLLSDNFHVVFGDMKRDEGCILKMPQPYLGDDNVLLAGEAAGMFYLNGEGISTAIDSGYRAGKAVGRAIKGSDGALEIYKKEVAGIIKHIELCIEKMHFLVG